MDLEQTATTEVIAAISKTDRLKAYVNSGDKEPAFDGNIYIYSNDKYAKKDDLKKVAIQVKGKTNAAKKIKDKIKYPISVNDLKIYMKNGGVMFFVVYIDTNARVAKQIYYSALLPMKIKEILKLNDDKRNEIGVRFKKLPTDVNNLTDIFFNFHSDAQKQFSFVGKETPTLEELKKSDKLESFSFGYVSSRGKVSHYEIPKIFANKEMYIYANVKDCCIPIPIEYYSNMEQICMSTNDNLAVSVKGVKYYNTINKTITAENIIYRIGTCMTLIVPNLSPSELKDNDFQVKVTIDIKGSLKQRIKSLEFLIAMFDAKCFEIDGCEFPADFPESEIKALNPSVFPERLKGYKKAQRVLDKLNVTKDLDLDNLSEEDKKKLDSLILAIEDEKKISGLSKDIPLVAKYSIGNIEVALVFKRNEDGTHTLWNFFDTYLPVEQVIDEKKYPISQFVILTTDNLITLDNINYKNIVDDFYRIDISEPLVNSANEVMLELIKAFDIKADRIYLDTAKQLLALQMEHTEYIKQTICELNELQITARERTLNFAEKKKLYYILEKNDDDFIKVGAYLLLDEQEEASKIIETMNENQFEKFSNLPIFKFYKKSQEEN